MHCIYTDNMFYVYSAIGRYASDAPIGDSISDVTEYRKKPNSDIEYRNSKNAQNHSFSHPVFVHRHPSLHSSLILQLNIHCNEANNDFTDLCSNSKTNLDSQAYISENMRRKLIKFNTENSTITFYAITEFYTCRCLNAPTVSE